MLRHKTNEEQNPDEHLDEVVRIALRLKQEEEQEKADIEAASRRQAEAERDRESKLEALKQMGVSP